MSKINHLQEPLADYDKAETDLLKEGLNRSYTERFHLMTSLMKMAVMFEKAEIKHKTFPSKK